jgi:hypothetical protein
MGGSVFASAKIPGGVVATWNTNEGRSDAVDDSRPPMDENENGMKAAGSVMKAAGSMMKAAGSMMKVRLFCLRCPVMREWSLNRVLLLNVSRGRSA